MGQASRVCKDGYGSGRAPHPETLVRVRRQGELTPPIPWVCTPGRAGPLSGARPLCADVGTVQKPRASGSNPGFTCVSCAAMRPPSEVDRRGQARRGPWWGSVSRRRGLAPAGLGSLPCCLQAGLPGEEGGPSEALVSVQCHVRGRSSTRSCSCYSQMPVLSNAWASPQPSSFSG